MAIRQSSQEDARYVDARVSYAVNAQKTRERYAREGVAIMAGDPRDRHVLPVTSRREITVRPGYRPEPHDPSEAFVTRICEALESADRWVWSHSGETASRVVLGLVFAALLALTFYHLLAR